MELNQAFATLEKQLAAINTDCTLTARQARKTP